MEDILQVATIDSLNKAFSLMGYRFKGKHRKVQIAKGIVKHIKENPRDVLERLDATSLQHVKELLQKGKGNAIVLDGTQLHTPLQKMLLVLSYEDTAANKTYIYLINDLYDIFAPVINEAKPIEKQKGERDETEGLPDAAKVHFRNLVKQYNEELTNTLTHLRVFNGYMKAAILLIVDSACDKIPYPSPFTENDKYEDALGDLLSALEQYGNEKEINKAADSLITKQKLIVWDFSKEILGKIEKDSFDEYDIPRILGLFVFGNSLIGSLSRLIRMDDKDIAALTKYYDTPTGRAINHSLFSLAEEVAEESKKGLNPIMGLLNAL